MVLLLTLLVTSTHLELPLLSIYNYGSSYLETPLSSIILSLTLTSTKRWYWPGVWKFLCPLHWHLTLTSAKTFVLARCLEGLCPLYTLAYVGTSAKPLVQNQVLELWKLSYAHYTGIRLNLAPILWCWARCFGRVYWEDNCTGIDLT